MSDQTLENTLLATIGSRLDSKYTLVGTSRKGPIMFIQDQAGRRYNLIVLTYADSLENSSGIKEYVKQATSKGSYHLLLPCKGQWTQVTQMPLYKQSSAGSDFKKWVDKGTNDPSNTFDLGYLGTLAIVQGPDWQLVQCLAANGGIEQFMVNEFIDTDDGDRPHATFRSLEKVAFSESKIELLRQLRLLGTMSIMVDYDDNSKPGLLVPRKESWNDHLRTIATWYGKEV